jgi:hypothetical protein
MSTASINAFQNRPSVENDAAGDRAAAEALFKMVSELGQDASARRHSNEDAPQQNLKNARTESRFSESHDDAAIVDSSDVSKTLCEWLTSVRLLQRDAADRKKMIASVAMLVFHSGVDDSGNDATLSKERLDFVGRAPGWNQNERKIICVLKSHFKTIKQLSGQNHNGISYTDLSNLFSSKKKLRERAALAASDEGAKTGIGIGIIFQIFVMLISFEFSLNLSLLFAVVGAIVGFCKEKSLRSILITGLKGALWGMTAGSAMGAVVAANQASRQFDDTLAPHVDSLREDLSQLTFEYV